MRDWTSWRALAVLVVVIVIAAVMFACGRASEADAEAPSDWVWEEAGDYVVVLSRPESGGRLYVARQKYGKPGVAMVFVPGPKEGK